MDVEEQEEEEDDADVEEEDRSQDREAGSRLCASLRNRNAHGHSTGAILYGN